MSFLRKNIFLLSLFFIVALFGCKKSTKINLQVDSIFVEDNIILRGIYFLNDTTGFVCGGKRDVEGYIYKTTNGGVSWSKTSISQPKCIYDIYFINDSVGFAGGDFLYLLKTTNAGKDWIPYSYAKGELPYHEQNRPAIKRFSFRNALEGYFVGGEDYKKGVIYKTFDGGLSWSFDTIKQEMMGASAIFNTAWVSGFGYVGKSTNGVAFEQVKLTNDVFTGVFQLSDNSVITISNTGGIYKSTDSGNTWKTVQKKREVFSKRVAFNNFSFSLNKGVVVGDEGLILISEDYGETWQETNFASKADLNDVTIINGKAYVTSSTGKLFIFSF